MAKGYEKEKIIGDNMVEDKVEIVKAPIKEGHDCDESRTVELKIAELDDDIAWLTIKLKEAEISRKYLKLKQ